MLKCDKICYKVGDFSISNLSFELSDGEACAVLGPSGAGKSLLLELIAGLRPLHCGALFLDGKEITNIPPQKREIGFLFQDYALFPHKNVYENIAYPLIIRKISRVDIERKVMKIGEELYIANLMKRMPSSLSGGEKQRVALARTLILQPKLLLLDEPLSALDTSLRSASLSLIHSLSERGISLLYITHNFREAAAIASKIFILDKGAIIQQGGADELMTNPVNDFVEGVISCL